MLAVDTNIIVRFLTRDDAAQFARADALIRDEDVYVCATVLLETEWVLRSVYGYTRSRITEALRDLIALPRVTVEDPGAAAKALEWAAGGMDFADALHLARTRHCQAFVTFDRRLAAAAGGIREVTVRPL
jgi:predicted nucleic-acid-binding protein